MATYYELNKEKIKEYGLKYKEQNKEKLKQYAKQYIERNKIKLNKYNIEYTRKKKKIYLNIPIEQNTNIIKSERNVILSFD